MPLKVSERVQCKLREKHKVTVKEVEECFLNRTKGLLEDTRTEHYSFPPTMWFIAPTDKNRLLKVVFIEIKQGEFEVKTAYEPNFVEVAIYEKYA